MASFTNQKNMMKSKQAVNRAIVWFRNDLRLHDNQVLEQAASVHAHNYLCVYSFDPRCFANSPYGSKKTGVFRAKFILESVQNLRSKLRSIGSDLLVTTMKPEDIIPKLLGGEPGGSVVYLQNETANEEHKVLCIS